MRRVLYVDEAPFAGGAQQSLGTLIQNLQRYQACGAGGPAIESFFPPGEFHPLAVPPFTRKAVALAAMGSFASARALVQVARGALPDLIHANGRSAWLCCNLATRWLRIPLVWHARDLARFSLFDRVAGHCCSACAAPSEVLARALETLPWHGASRIWMIPNGIDTNRFQPGDRRRARERFGLPCDRLLIGMIGQWAPWKRVDLFLEAARSMAVNAPGAYFVLCGAPAPGEPRELAEDYRQYLGAHGRLISWVTDIQALYPALDIVVQPSEGEAFGRVAVEAMSCGVPVVAARAGALPETVVDGETGLLFTPGNAVDLVDRIRTLIASPDRRRSLGEAGRRRVESRFTAAEHVRKVEGLYDTLLGVVS